MRNKIIFFLFLFFVVIYVFYPKNNETFTNLEEIHSHYPEKNYVSVNSSDYPSKYSTTYGEVLYEGLENIFKCCQENNIPTNSFTDLGSGTGRSLHYAILAGFDKAKGVELAKERHEYAYNILDKSNDGVKNKISIQNEDIFKLPKEFFNDTRTIFVSNLVYPDKTNEKLLDFLSNNTAKGTLLFLSKLPKDLKGFKELNTIRTPMSWDSNSNMHVLIKE